MQEVPTCIEELEEVLSIRERLTGAEGFVEMLDATHEAVYRILACDGNLSSIRVEADPLIEIRDKTRDSFDIVLVRAYEMYWEGAQEESTEEIGSLEKMMDIFVRSVFDENAYTDTCAAIDQETRKGYSEYRINGLQRKYDAHHRPLPMTPEEQFNEWKAAEIDEITERTTEIQLQMQRLKEGAPAGFVL